MNSPPTGTDDNSAQHEISPPTSPSHNDSDGPADADSDSVYESPDPSHASETPDHPPPPPLSHTPLDPPVPARAVVEDYLHLKEPITVSPVDLEPTANLLMQFNLKRIDDMFHQKSKAEQASVKDGIANHISLFNHLKSAITANDSSRTIDWDQWQQLLEQKLTHDQMAGLVANGIPDEIRSSVWQVTARSSTLKLNDYYLMNKQTPSIHERQIKKDITRNSFYNSIQQYDKINEVFSNLKIYSEYDQEIGYNQSFIFLISPIILKLPELESFSLFVSLMKDYNLRELYDSDMKGLQLMLYKFDRLMEIYHPSLFNHLIKRGIRSNSFASQWFLTLFSYKFPIDVILRIYDFVIFEGVDFLLKLALRLMALNESILLRLNSDSLLAYLNTNILDVLVRKDFQPGSNQYYDTSKIFTGFTNLNPNLLQKFEAEFQKLYALNEKKLDDINLLNLTNGKLRNQIKYLQMDLFNLNKDHLQVVQGLINLKVRLPELMSQNSDLEDDIQSLINTLNDMKDFKEDDVPHNIEQHIEQLLVENKSETERNIALEDQLNELVEQEHQVDSQLKALKKGWFWNK